MCKCRARARILRIGICRPEQKRRGSASDTAAGPKDREEDVLRGDGKLRHPAALRSARCDSDHSQPDDYLRAPSGDDEIIIPTISPEVARCQGGSAGADLRFSVPDH